MQKGEHKADCFTAEALDSGSEGEVFTLNYLRVFLSNYMSASGNIFLITPHLIQFSFPYSALCRSGCNQIRI